MTVCRAEDVSYDNWIQVVSDLIDAEIERDGRPVVLFGVSLGGMLAYQAACRSGEVSGVIATTLADPSDRATREQLARHPMLARLGGPLLTSLRPITDSISLPIKWLSRMHHVSNEPEIVKLLVKDRTSAGSWVPLRFMRTLMGSRPLIAPEDFELCPVLLAHPEVDRMTPLRFSRSFYDRLGGDKELVILENAGHMPLETPGIDQLERAVLRFLRSVAGASSVGPT
jgi:alpha-beta hydrolase superfamily lysophospholipase